MTGERSEAMVNLIKNARIVIQTISDIEDPFQRELKATAFIMALQLLQQMAGGVALAESQEQIDALFAALDEAIVGIESADDDIAMSVAGGFPFNPGNKGSA
jgi:hypothetical protein